MKTDSVFNVSPLFNIPEQTQKFEQKKLNRPNKYKLSKVGKNFIKSQETCIVHAYNDPDPNADL